jgi:hypothetical protein
LNVKMKRSKKRCRLGVAIPDRLFFLQKMNKMFERNVKMVIWAKKQVNMSISIDLSITNVIYCIV